MLMNPARPPIVAAEGRMKAIAYGGGAMDAGAAVSVILSVLGGAAGGLGIVRVLAEN
jgi:hypothetical protein